MYITMRSFFRNCKRKLEKNELFITHYRDNYDAKYPIWVAIEPLKVELGTVSVALRKNWGLASFGGADSSSLV